MSDQPTAIANDAVVTLQYVLKLDDGTVVDETNANDGDFVYLHGHKNIVPGLESALAGQAVGAAVDATVMPEDGYGIRLDGAMQTVGRDSFPDDAEIQPGMQFAAETPEGQVVPVYVFEVTDESVVLDMNHPLAGETLHFAVKVMGIRAATGEELEHGHVHGPGGHDH